MMHKGLAASSAAVIMAGACAMVASPVVAQSVYVTQIAEVRNLQSATGVNRSSIVQTGDGKSAVVEQAGRGNDARIMQRGTGGGSALIAQRGQDNQAGISQTGAARDVASIRQYGSGNIASASQSSAGAGANSISLTQMGDRNYATALQNGGDNSLYLLQNGEKSAMVSQSGRSDVSLVQTGPGPASISLNVAAGRSLSVMQDTRAKTPPPAAVPIAIATSGR